MASPNALLNAFHQNAAVEPFDDRLDHLRVLEVVLHGFLRIFPQIDRFLLLGLDLDHRVGDVHLGHPARERPDRQSGGDGHQRNEPPAPQQGGWTDRADQGG